VGGGAHQRHFPPGEAPSLVAGAFEREPTKAVFGSAMSLVIAWPLVVND
jgi:hypothetical protein